MIRKLTWAGALVLVCALPLTAQEAGTDATADAFERAQAAGIPLTLLESKMAEGRAKGVPMDVIEQAVQRRTDALIAAAATFEQAGAEDVGAADLSVAADAMENGVSATVLQTIAETAPTERRAVAIAALTYLVAEGTVPEDALARVQDALARGPGALSNLSGGIPDGVLPDAAGVPADVGDAGTGGVPDGVPAGNAGSGGPPDGVPTP